MEAFPSTKIRELKAFVQVTEAKPELLHQQELQFFREFIESFGGTISPLPKKIDPRRAPFEKLTEAATEDNLQILLEVLEKETFDFAKESFETKKFKFVEKEEDQELGSQTFPLLEAAKKGNLCIVKALLKKGFNVNQQNENGDHALLTAMVKGNDELLSVLLDAGASTEMSNQNGMTPILMAAANGKDDFVITLAKFGANIHCSTVEGRNLFIIAANAGCKKAVPFLIDQGVNINAQDKYGHSALHLLAQTGFVWMMDLLLKSGANLELRDSTGKTPLLFALNTTCGVKSIKFLIEKGSNVKATDNSNKSAVGMSLKLCTLPLVLEAGCCFQNKVQIVQEWMRRTDRLNILRMGLKYLVPFEPEEQKAIMFYLKGGKKDREKVLCLVEGKMDPNLTNERGETVLFSMKSPTHITTFLEHGLDINHVAKNGYTVLLHTMATQQIDLFFLNFLLCNNADIRSVDPDGRDFIAVAKKYSNGKHMEKLHEIKFSRSLIKRALRR